MIIVFQIADWHYLRIAKFPAIPYRPITGEIDWINCQLPIVGSIYFVINAIAAMNVYVFAASYLENGCRFPFRT